MCEILKRSVALTGFIISLLALSYAWGMSSDGEGHALVSGSFTLSVQQDMLSAQLYQVPLYEVFKELSQHMPIIVALQASVAQKIGIYVFYSPSTRQRA